MSGSVKLCSFTSPRTPKAPATLAIRMRRPESMSICPRGVRAGGGSGRGGLLAGGFLHQHADLVGQLRAVGDPVVDAGEVELDALLVAGRDRVVEAEALDRAA